MLRTGNALATRLDRPVNWDDAIVDAAVTDTGMRRANNQDSHTIVRAANAEAWKRRGHLFMVADGMGAHAVGELASKLACDNIPHNYFKAKDGTAAEAMTKAYRQVGALIHGKAAANKEFQGMGTTCSSLLLLPEGALIAHVGDSRVYRIRGDRIEQLSFDHSLVWELIRRNHMHPDQAHRAVPRNVITRSLGPDPQVEVDIEGPHPVEPGDVYLLCSDGLSGPVTDPELGAFAAHFHPETSGLYLIHLANLRGGHDNITVVLARIGPWTEPGAEPEAATNGPAARRPGLGARLGQKLRGALQRRPAVAAEEHIYRSCDCPVDPALLEGLADSIRQAQAVAVDQAWTVDWHVLTNLRRESEEARQSGDLRSALRCLGEAIVLLGTAGRVHKKTHGAAGVK